MTDFLSMGLPAVLQDSLVEKLKFTTPTPIQAQAVPPALEGRDILGSAQTGTGKTIAFLIPILVHLLKPENKDSVALIITPTRELAQQVLDQAISLGTRSFLTKALLIGGDSMFKQLKQLRANPRLIIGTPGRINDHIRRNSVALNRCDFLVLDETDRMLDMGFSVQLETILAKLNQDRQTLLFSATLPDNARQISKKYLQDPVRVKIDQDNSPSKNIDQQVISVQEKEKYDTLIKELEKREGTIIVFMKTKFSTERMVKRLMKDGYSCDAIHGDLRQSRRSRVISGFRKSKFRILVATDVAARGLDIPHIEHVVNHDLPQCPEDYIHRIGRTARAGAKGSAINLVSPADKRLWQAIDVMMNPEKAVNMRKQSGKSKGSFSKNKSRFSKSSSERSRSIRERGQFESNNSRSYNSFSGNNGEGFKRREKSFADNDGNRRGEFNRKSRFKESGNSNGNESRRRSPSYADVNGSDRGEFKRKPRFNDFGNVNRNESRKSGQPFAGASGNSRGDFKRKSRFNESGNSNGNESRRRSQSFADVDGNRLSDFKRPEGQKKVFVVGSKRKHSSPSKFGASNGSPHAKYQNRGPKRQKDSADNKHAKKSKRTERVAAEAT